MAKVIDEAGNKYERLTVIKRATGKYRRLHWICKCDCGNIAIVNGTSLRLGYTRSCGCLNRESMSRIGKARRKYSIASNPQLERTLPEYKLWRLAVFQRDSFSCISCGKIGTYLHAHHINSFIDNPELRLTLDNGVTLCKECHYDIHKARRFD